MDKKKAKHQILSYLLLIPLLFWMGIIFVMSHTPAKESTEMSLWVGSLLSRLLIPGFSAWDAGKQLLYIESIDFFVRKAAHASEYGVLAILFYLNFRYARNDGCCLQALCCTIIYAMSDEFHQLFIPGRSGQIRDVLIDSTGAALGILFVVLLQKLIGLFRKRK